MAALGVLSSSGWARASVGRVATLLDDVPAPDPSLPHAAR
jgi:hypothetical protein